MVKIEFIFTDSKDCFLIPKEQLESLVINDVHIDYEYYPNNSNSLASIFNTVLDSDRSKYDSIVFMHGDVQLDVNKFIEHLISIKDKYDVIGLAGTKKMNVSNSPLNWFTSSHSFPTSRYGDISMYHNNKLVRAFYNQIYAPNVTDTKVACIDGLCICFMSGALKTDMRFDDTISKFDFYDTDISLQCVMKYKLRLGVMIEPTIHKSVGMSILSPQFLQSERKFRDKWQLYKES